MGMGFECLHAGNPVLLRHQGKPGRCSPGSHSCGPAMVALNATNGDDTVMPCPLCISQQELQLAHRHMRSACSHHIWRWDGKPAISGRG